MNRVRNALTLIELMVAISITGIMMSLLVVGINSARGASKKLACSNNLAQLSLAVQLYHGSHGHYPTRTPPSYPFQDLLPYLEEAIDRETSPDTYLCPSDDYALSAQGHVSYLFNEGFAGQVFGSNGMMPGVYEKRLIRNRDITDGLAATAGLSEKLQSLVSLTNAEARRRPLRSNWFVGPGYSAQTMTAVDNYLHACLRSRSLAVPLTTWGDTVALKQSFGYNHMLGPNQAPCHHGGPTAAPFPPSQGPHTSIIPPSSLHSGGVNLAMLDGSVRFVTDAVSWEIWHAWGTRSGGEHGAL